MCAQFCPVSCPFKLLDRKPERLVVTGLRCCVAGYNFGDIEPFPIGLEQSDRVKRLDYIYSGALPYRQSRATLAGSALRGQTLEAAPPDLKVIDSAATCRIKAR